MTRRRRHRDYTPDLIDILDQLIKLYEKRGVDVQATSFRKASHALRDQIVTSAEEVDKLTKIHGVVKATADMFKEFINTGGIWWKKNIKILRSERYRGCQNPARTKLVRAGVVPCRSSPLGGERARAERALLVDLTQEPHEAQGEETARGRATREGSHTIVVAAGERYGERREESRRDRDSLRRLRRRRAGERVRVHVGLVLGDDLAEDCLADAHGAGGGVLDRGLHLRGGCHQDEPGGPRQGRQGARDEREGARDGQTHARRARRAGSVLRGRRIAVRADSRTGGSWGGEVRVAGVLSVRLGSRNGV